jgi:hypothetical protein
VESTGISDKLEQVGVPNLIAEHLKRHVNEHTLSNGSPIQNIALAETLKLLFNLTRSSNGVPAIQFIW